jgi:alpha-tubulin suppressor-like RCC1 family protein
LTGVVAIAAGDNHSLALKSNGTVVAWGSNSNGQIGDNSSGNNRLVPTAVSGVTTVAAVAGGQNHSLALKTDGTLVAWGNNGTGQLGDGTQTQRLTPTPVSALSGVTSIGAGTGYSVAVRGVGAAGRLWAWGKNDVGQLGDGTLTQRLSAVSTGYAGLEASAGTRHVFARRMDGFAWGTGANDNRQLGVGGVSAREPVPRRTIGLVEPLRLTAGANHSAALTTDGSVLIWGNNQNGQLGTGSTATQTQPLLVAGLSLVSNAWLTEDTDLDGLMNAAEYRHGSDPLLADTNGDGVADGAAVLSGRSVTGGDTDGDGLLNADEIHLGTDPLVADSDGDGTLDGADCYPLDATQTQCGTPNPSDQTGPVVTLAEPSNAVLLP